MFNGKNTTADGYIEYFKINSTNETVDFNKEIDVSENVVMKPNKFLYFDETSKVRYIRSSARSTPSVPNHLDIINEDGSQGRIRLLIGSNGSNTTDEQFLVDNTIISCKRNLRAGAGLESNTIDTIGSANLSFQRGGTEYLRFDTTDDNITCSKEIIAGNSIVDTAKKLTMKPSLESDVNILDIRNLHPVVDNPMIRFRVGEGGGATIVCEMTNNAMTVSRNLIMGTAYELRTNAIDTVNDNDLVISRNNIPFLTLDKFTEDTVEKEAIICSKQLRANANMLVKKLQINQISVGIEYADFRLEDASNSIMRFYVGNSTSVNLQIAQTATLNEILLNRATKCSNVFHTNTINSNGNATLTIQQNNNSFISLLGDALNRVQINRFLRVVDGGGSTQAQFVNNSNGKYMEFRLGNHINAYAAGTPVNGNTLHLNYYSHGDVMLGTIQDTGEDPIPTISIDKFKSGAGNAFEVQGDSVFSGTVSTNTLNSETGDLVFERLGTEYMRFQGSDFTIRMNYSVISTNTYIDNHRPTAFGVDTFFYGNNSADNGYIEYFRFNHANQRCDYFVNINSNSNITCVDLVETSDKRLKDNIKDVDEDCSEIVKKVNVKTYNLKSDDKKKNHIGFIAQEIKEILPDKFEAVVNEDSEFMGINYGKMSAILWKCCQEQQNKIEHLEARLFELEDIVKDKKNQLQRVKQKQNQNLKQKM